MYVPIFKGKYMYLFVRIILDLLKIIVFTQSIVRVIYVYYIL